jgi:TonB family protein
MKSLGIDHIALLAALALHALALLAVRVDPGVLRPERPERPQRIAVRLLPAPAPAREEQTPERSVPPAVKPRPSVEKENQNQTSPRPAPAPLPDAAAREPLPAPAGPAEPVAPAEPAPAATTPPAAAASPAAAPPSTAAATAAAGRLDDYLALVRARVEENKDYPAFARQLGQQGTVVVRARVGRDGRLLQAAVLNSSGHKQLDKAALAAVRGAGRFRPPTEFGLTEVTVDIPIAYKLI